jgi:hypothetical protein
MREKLPREAIFGRSKCDSSDERSGLSVPNRANKKKDSPLGWNCPKQMQDWNGVRPEQEGTLWSHLLDSYRRECFVEKPRVRMQFTGYHIDTSVGMNKNNCSGVRYIPLHGKQRPQHHMNLDQETWAHEHKREHFTKAHHRP